ncbi:MAG: DUF192 domain-containing protein [Lentisphaeria bacterium]|nr:DUF192 domain-containing protein [Lentisphaeria bacterium]
MQTAVYNQTRTAVLACRMVRAESFWQRFMGLMGKRRFPGEYDALLFEKCNSIHCFFMFMEIDVLFIDRKKRVVKSVSALKPWHLAWGGWKSAAVIELPAGTLEKTGTLPGDQLEFN